MRNSFGINKSADNKLKDMKNEILKELVSTVLKFFIL